MVQHAGALNDPLRGGTRQPDERAALTSCALTKRYGTHTVVDRLDLVVPEHAITGFVGPNGAGKTTTIRMLLGLVRPTSGTATVLGRSHTRPGAYLPAVGALIEGPAFHPGLSGRANLRLLTRAGNLPRSRVEECLERVGLSARGVDLYRSYSLGMKQRLGIAAALLPSPKLLILDEPTNGLDPAGIIAMRELLRSLKEEGATVLVSSHLLAEVEQIADHLVMIKEGRSIFQGGLQEMVQAQQPYVVVSPEVSADRPALEDLIRDDLGWATVAEAGSIRAELPASDTSGSLQAAADLNRRAHQSGITLARLEVHRPTLEETFMALTGTASGDVR